MKELIERRKILKSKFQSRKKIFGAWTSLFHPSITEIFTRTGVDFIGIDIEHSTISQEQSQRIIAAAQAEGSLCFPRIATHNNQTIKRLLDSGADGIIAPTVQSADDVKQLLSWIKYPPQGKRGFGIARAQGYGFDFDAYIKSWNETSSFICQIETIEGVENIEKILSIKEVDGVMVGPYDLSGSLGIPGQLDHPKVQEAAKHVIFTAKRFKKTCGTQVIEPDVKNVQEAFTKGFNFVILSSDVFLLWKWAARMQGLVRKLR